MSIIVGFVEMGSTRQPSEIVMRRANLDDAKLLFEWRNTELIRLVSKSQDVIPWESHMAWFSKKLLDAEYCHLMIFEIDGVPVGMSRLEINNRNNGEISIIIDAKYQNGGIGTKCLIMITDYAREGLLLSGITAFVHRNNLPSKKLFEKVGFIDSVVNGDFLKYQLKVR